jgi:hypothetical protein
MSYIMKTSGPEIVSACRNMAECLARYNKKYRNDLQPIQALISGYAGPYLWENNLAGWTYNNRNTSRFIRSLRSTLYDHRYLTELEVPKTVNFLQAV